MIDNIDEYSEMWANGQNIGKLWDIIKAKFVAGYPGDGDTTSHVIDQSGYGERWFTQARMNIGLPRSTFVDDMYVGRAKADESGNNIKATYANKLAIYTENNASYLGLYNKNNSVLANSSIILNSQDGLVRLNGGKIPLALFPDAIAGQMLFAGTVDEFIDHSSASPATSVDLLKVTLTDNAANKLHEKISSITTSNKVVYLTTASSSGTYNSKPMVSYVDCEGMYFLWTSNAIASGQTSREWSGERFQVGDWLVSVGGITAQSGEDGWRKIDNTDAVTSVAGINDANVDISIYGTPTITGPVVMNAGRVRALDTGLPNNTQTVAGNVQFNKDVWALGGLAAYGISDLTRGGGGGGGLSGSILRDWANFNPNDETQILGSNLGIEAFQMSGSKMQFKRNNAWVDGFTLQAANIPNLDLTQINGTTELRKIETLATGSAAGFLKRASNGTWSFDTNTYALNSALANYVTLATAQEITATKTFSNATYGESLIVKRNTNGGNPAIKFINSTEGWIRYLGFETSNQVAENSCFYFTTDDTSTKYYMWNNGNFKSVWGRTIGSNADILGDIKLATSGGGANADSAVLRFNGSVSRDVGGPSIRAISGGQNYGRHRLAFYQHDADDYTTESEVMSILANGKVGIGTTAPDELLHVAGKIKGTQLISTIADGTAPFDVTSKTLVTNLNADYLDGKHNGELTALNMQQEPMQATQEFTYRACPKTIDVDSVKLDKIKGKTLVWNQWVDLTTFSKNNNSDTLSSVTASGATITSGHSGDALLQKTTIIPVGHKVYASMSYKASASGVVAVIYMGTWSGSGYISKTTTDTNWHKLAGILTTSATVRSVGIVNSTSGQSLQMRDVVFIDLTQMFGEGNEPSLADFEKLYLPKYYSYNAGQLINNSAKAFESVGFNLWDEQWELGTLNYQNGEKGSSTTSIVTKNYIPVLPNTTYYRNVPASYGNSSSFCRAAFYDKDFKYLGGASGDANAWINFDGQTTFTSPNNAYYMRFTVVKASYTNDICVNHSKTTGSPKNGDYLPHKKVVTELNLHDIHVYSPNIWDEEWEQGYFYESSGEIRYSESTTTCIRSKNLIPVEPNTTYNGSTQVGYLYRVAQFDKDGNYIRGASMSNGSGNLVFTTGSNTSFIKFMTESYGSTYNNDICINISDPAFNGRYFPHGELTFNGLKSAGDVYDEITNNGRTLIRRVCDLDLGSLTWTLSGSTANAFYWEGTTLPEYRKSNDCGIINSKSYAFIGVSTGTQSLLNYDKAMSLLKDSYAFEGIYIKDTAYSTAAAFKTAMNGQWLYYELKNYETYELVEPIPTAMFSGTTERRLPEDTADSVIAPFVADMTYGTNAGDILASSTPWDRVSGKPKLEILSGRFSDPLVSNEADNGIWFKNTIDGKNMCIKFAVSDKAFHFTLADDDGNPVLTKSFNFATLAQQDIIDICV